VVVQAEAVKVQVGIDIRDPGICIDIVEVSGNSPALGNRQLITNDETDIIVYVAI